MVGSSAGCGASSRTLETAQAAILGNRVADVAAMIGLARKAMAVAADICVYTNDQITIETLDSAA